MHKTADRFERDLRNFLNTVVRGDNNMGDFEESNLCPSS